MGVQPLCGRRRDRPASLRGAFGAAGRPGPPWGRSLLTGENPGVRATGPRRNVFVVFTRPGRGRGGGLFLGAPTSVELDAAAVLRLPLARCRVSSNSRRIRLFVFSGPPARLTQAHNPHDGPVYQRAVGNGTRLSPGTSKAGRNRGGFSLASAFVTRPRKA